MATDRKDPADSAGRGACKLLSLKRARNTAWSSQGVIKTIEWLCEQVERRKSKRELFGDKRQAGSANHSPVCETMHAEKTGAFFLALPTCAWAMPRRTRCFSSLCLA